jgi:predicted nucleic acid-binding protein
MIVVSDTSPLNYLVLIGADQVLPSLFGEVLAPPEVLAQECQAAAVLIDERDGTAVAQELGLVVTGTLAILTLASEKGLLSLPTAFAALRQTIFRGPATLMDELLRIDAARHAANVKPDGNS